VAVDFAQELKDLRATMDSVREVTDLDKLKSQISELEEQSGAPDLWDHPEHAQEVTSRLSRANSELERVTGMYDRIDELEVLVQLGQEEADADTMAEAERELASLRKAVGELEVRTLLNGEYDEREAVVTIRSGAGGVDAADFAEMLMRMYLRWAERHGYPTTVMDTSYAEEAGLKSATFEVKVPYAFGTLAIEAGTHRLVRISPFDNQGRRQTSFAAVEVIPLIAQTDSIEIPDNEIKVDVFRSSGPGGQSVNTTDSAVRMTHIPTGIVVSM
jgi:peptide chain release factor 2